MARVIFEDPDPSTRVDVAIVGAGACGLTAALAAREAGAEVLVLERDAVPAGSTSMSTGQIPAAGTRFQREIGVHDDSPELLAADIMAESRNTADPVLVDAVARLSGPTVEWLADVCGIPFEVIDGFTQHGHSRLRMHVTANRSGRELHTALLAACGRAGVAIATACYAEDLHATPGGRVTAVGVRRPGGGRDVVGCGALVLACHGFAGNPELMRRYCPDLAGAYFYGHAGNTGEAVLWGEQLGARTADLGSAQCHASIAYPDAIQISWATMREGGFQVNLAGHRFGDESRSYSAHAPDVISQPQGLAWSVFDRRIEAVAAQIEEFRRAMAAGVIRSAATLPELAAVTGIDLPALGRTFDEVRHAALAGEPDRFGRRFRTDTLLRPPYRAARVTGAVLMTQGGLCVDGSGRVQGRDGPLPNLFAGGGAARGVSGPAHWGYFSGAGLLTALTLGRAAGGAAAGVGGRA